MRILLAILLLADIVHLKNGGKVEGKVTLKGDAYEIETDRGVLAIPKDDVLRIEKKEYAPKGVIPRKAAVKLGPSYGHPFLAFKIQLPAQWQRGKEQGKATVSFWGPKDQFYQPRMDLFVESSKLDLGEQVKRYKDQFRKSFTGVLFPFEGVTAIRGKTAYQFSSVFTDGDPPIQHQTLWTFVTDGERAYTLAFTCTQNWFDRYSTVVDASMRSLRILPPPSATREQQQQFSSLYNKAVADYAGGKLKEAASGFEEAAKLVPEFPDVHAAVGAIRMKLNDYPAAEAAFRAAARIDPEDSAHPYNLGVCLLKLSRHAEAIAELKKAVDLDPSSEPALTNLGVAYLVRELNIPARETLEKAVQLDPESAPAHYNLGLVLERLDRKRDAEREYREALKIDPKHEEAKKSLERLKAK